MLLTLAIVSSVVALLALVWHPRKGVHSGGGPEGTHTVAHVIDTLEMELESYGRHTKRRSVAQRDSSYLFDS
jgi:hypothetical protein